MTTTKNQRMAYFYLSIAQIVVGLNVTLAKFIIENMPTYVYLGMRFWFTAIVLGLGVILCRKPLMGDKKEGLLTWGLFWLLVLQGLTGCLLFNIFTGWGLAYTSASSAGIVCSTLPAFIAIFSWLILKEKITSRVSFSIILAVIGLIILNLDNVQFNSDTTMAAGSLIGDLLVLLAVLPEALYSIIGKFVGKRINVFVGAFWVNFTTAVIFTPIMAYGYWSEPAFTMSPVIWAAVLVSALCSVVFFSSWMKGLNEVQASKAGIFGSLMPVTAALTAIVFLGENFNIYNGLGMLFVLISIWVGASQSGKDKARNDVKSTQMNAEREREKISSHCPPQLLE